MSEQVQQHITESDAILIERAAELVLQYHRNQRDKAGMPYFLHPFAVVLQFRNPRDIMAALLHDSIEDTEITASDLLAERFSEEVVETVMALSRNQRESYQDFILRCKVNPQARRIKLADLRHNTAPERQASLTDSLRVRYESAICELSD